MSLWKQIAPILLSTTAVFVVPELFGFKLTSEHFLWIAIIGLWMSSNLLWSRQPTTWKKKFLDKLIWAEPIEPAHQRPTIEARNPAIRIRPVARWQDGRRVAGRHHLQFREGPIVFSNSGFGCQVSTIILAGPVSRRGRGEPSA